MDERTVVEPIQKIKLDPVGCDGTRIATRHDRERETAGTGKSERRSRETVCRDVRQPRP